MQCPICKKNISDKEALFCPYCASRLNFDVTKELNDINLYLDNVQKDNIDNIDCIVVKSKNKPHKYIFIVLVILLIIFSILIISKLVQVPELIGLSKQQAVLALENIGMSYTISEEYSVESDGMVIDQIPKAGIGLFRDKNVKITISKIGTEIPDVKGMESSLAKIELKKYGFETEFEYIIDDTISKNHVIKTEPSAGTIFGNDKTIKSWVSLGGHITIPDWIGQDYNDIQTGLDKMDLSIIAIQINNA